MIKISHEVPLCLLEESKQFCNYLYALPHLLEENEIYRIFFLKAKEEKIEIYLDNSLHEKGFALQDDLLFKWLNILEPEVFFVPDVWEDMIESIINARRWSILNVPPNTIKTAIIQAKSLDEARYSYQVYKDLGYKKIAFSYGNSYYNQVSGHDGAIGKALGRSIVIEKLFNESIIKETDQIHLLGTAWPAEFGLYKHYSFITSIDTSSPIMATIDGTRYTEVGLSEKPKSNLNNCFNISKDKIDMELLNYNIKKFREINGL